MDAFDTLPMCPDEFNIRADLAKARSTLIAMCTGSHICFSCNPCIHPYMSHTHTHAHTHMYLYTLQAGGETTVTTAKRHREDDAVLGKEVGSGVGSGGGQHPC